MYLKSSFFNQFIKEYSFRIQEVWNGNEYIEDNLPNIMDCECRNDLVDKVKPGDFVAVKGKLQVHDFSGKSIFFFLL